MVTIIYNILVYIHILFIIIVIMLQTVLKGQYQRENSNAFFSEGFAVVVTMEQDIFCCSNFLTMLENQSCKIG